jgi:hypothetical protein
MEIDIRKGKDIQYESMGPMKNVRKERKDIRKQRLAIP